MLYSDFILFQPSNEEPPHADQTRVPAVPAKLNSSPKPFRSAFETRPLTENANHQTTSPYELQLSSPVDLKTPSAFLPYKKPPIASYLSKPEITNNNIPYATENFSYDKFVESSKPIEGLAAQYSEKLNINDRGTPEKLVIHKNTSGNRVNVNEKDAQNNNWCVNDIQEPNNKHRLDNQPISKKSTNTTSNQIGVSSSPKNVDGKFLKIADPVEKFLAVSSHVPNVPQLSSAVTSGVNLTPKIRIESPEKRDVCAIPQNFMVPDASCHQCKLDLQPGQVVVVAERAGVEVTWHPQCFVCVICQVNLTGRVDEFPFYIIFIGESYVSGTAGRLGVFLPSRRRVLWTALCRSIENSPLFRM